MHNETAKHININSFNFLEELKFQVIDKIMYCL